MLGLSESPKHIICIGFFFVLVIFAESLTFCQENTLAFIKLNQPDHLTSHDRFLNRFLTGLENLTSNLTVPTLQKIYHFE